MNRSIRQAVAAETLQILQTGGYTTGGQRVDFLDELQASVNATQSYTPSQLSRMVAASSPGKCDTATTVANETTFAAARRLAADHSTRVLCLNFASAKNPGGGFQSGAHA